MNKFDINLNLYRSFYYVAKFGGFTKASTHINTSQSSLSASVKNLEDLLNKKLFVRTSTDVTLTNYGRELYLKLDEIKNILDDELLHNDKLIENYVKSRNSLGVILEFIGGEPLLEIDLID